jgi:FkbM family methyltransferase
MTYQGLLLKTLSSGAFRRLGLGQRYLQSRSWVVESGEGAGLRLKLPQNSDYISGQSEIPVQQELARHLGVGGVVYDIGANVGFFSLIAARLVGQAGCVYSFEPVAENAASTCENVRLNNLGNVKLFDVAVGRSSGTAELLLTHWDGGSSLATSAVKPDEPISRRTVQVVALDDLVDRENLRPPSFVKIDVEGVELDVLAGMSKTIASAKPILLYEVDDGSKDSFERRWSELDAYVNDLGYEVAHLRPSYENAGWNVGHSLAIPRERPLVN